MITITAGKPEAVGNFFWDNSKAFNDSDPLGKNSDSSFVVTVLNSGAQKPKTPTKTKKTIMETNILDLEVDREAIKANIFLKSI